MSPRILVVCTANVCRSPMAATLLTAACGEHGIAVRIDSAGLNAVRLGADPIAVGLMADRGLDMSNHTPRQIVLADVVEADLVVAMTREHVRSLVTDHRSPLARTFTLKELARRIRERPGVPIAGLGGDRAPADLLGRSALDDIDDPFGRQIRHYEVCVTDLERSVDALVSGMRSGLLPGSES